MTTIDLTTTSPSTLAAPAPRSAASPATLSLMPGAVVRPALASRLRPALVVQEREVRLLLAEAQRRDVTQPAGCFSAGPAGVQLWSGPFDGADGTHGTAELLGAVDWTYDTPVHHYATVYRAMVTTAGVARRHSPHSVLSAVLALGNVSVDGDRLSLPVPPPRDPFRRG